MKKHAYNRVDMVGKTYNSWTVLEHSHTNGKLAYYKAVCGECNTQYVVDGRNLRSGASKRCSPCGNKKGHDKQKGQIRTKRIPQESAYHYLTKDLKKWAKARGKTWELNVEQVKIIVSSNCNYCNSEPGLACNPLRWNGMSQRHTEGANIIRNGIDRIDSSKGYIPGNVVPCCQTCNKAKLEMSVEEFLNWGKRLYEHNFTG